MTNNDITQILTCDEAVEYLRCGYNTLYRLLDSGEIPAFKEGTKWKIPFGGIQNFAYFQHFQAHVSILPQQTKRTFIKMHLHNH